MTVGYIVTLTDDEHDALVDMTRRGERRARRLLRAHVLLMAEQRAHTDEEIAAALSIGTSMVYRTKKRFVVGGLEHALSEAPRPGGARKLDAKHEATLVALACSKPPGGRAKWTLQLLADRLVVLTDLDEVSPETIRRRLNENELESWQKRMWCIPELDADYVANMEDVLDLYHEPADPKRPLVCFDETPEQRIGEARVPIPASPGATERVDYEYVRNGKVNLFMFMVPWLGWRHVKVTERKGNVDFAECMRDLVDIHFADAERIRVVMDNLSTHRPGALYKAFPADEGRRILRRLELHYTPKHGSWLNMAENEIGVMNRQCLDRRIPSADMLTREVAVWEGARNEQKATIDWMFEVAAARKKLARAYPLEPRAATPAVEAAWWPISHIPCGRLLVGITSLALCSSCTAPCNFIELDAVHPAMFFTGPAPSSSWSDSVACRIDDLDQDGFDDFMLGCAGEVNVYSARKGRVIYTIASPPESSNFGHAICSLGDIDSDGVSDFAISAPGSQGATLPGGQTPNPPGSVFLYSGHDGTLLKEFHGSCEADCFGESLLSLGDLDADGLPELAIGVLQVTEPDQANWYDRNGKILVVSTGSGRTLYEVKGSEDELLGIGLACYGDVDGDGIADFVALGHYSAKLISARTGSILHDLDTASGYVRTVQQVAPVDMDADGCPDALVGIFFEDKFEVDFPGWLRVFSGKSGKCVKSLKVSGWSASVFSDPQHKEEFWQAGSNSRTAEIIDPLGRTKACVTGSRSGDLSVTLLGDLDHDGSTEILVLATESAKPGLGSFSIYSVGSVGSQKSR